MRKAVAQQFYTFNADPHLEGEVRKMYLDVKRLVTTGVGNLIDPMPLAEPLPWKRDADDKLATIAEVRSCWTRVKNDHTLNELDGGVQYAHLPGNTLHLDPADISVLVKKKALEMEAHLRRRPQFAHYDSWPADAQLGALSICWACGENFQWPKFLAAAAKDDFATMAKESSIKNNPNRSAANKQLFQNAARVVKEGLDPEVLLYAPPWQKQKAA